MWLPYLAVYVCGVDTHAAIANTNKTMHSILEVETHHTLLAQDLLSVLRPYLLCCMQWLQRHSTRYRDCMQ